MGTSKNPAFDSYQQIVADSYGAGDHCCTSPEQECGDTLLLFLMRELSEEDCGNYETAITRLDTAIDQLRCVQDAFQKKLNIRKQTLFSQDDLLSLPRDVLESIARDKCPPEEFYDLQDNMDSTKDGELIELILTSQGGKPE